MEKTNIGYMVAFAIGSNNNDGLILQNNRGSVTQALAQFTASKPDAATLVEFCEGVVAGYKAAAEKGFKVGQNAPSTLCSQVRKLSGNPETTYKRNADDAIVGFGEGSISKEYNRMLWIESTAIQKVAKLQTRRAEAVADHAKLIEQLDRDIATFMAQIEVPAK